MNSSAIIDSQFIPEVYSQSQTLIELLRSRMHHQPNRRAYTFLIDEGTVESTLTYEELDRKARAIGAWLQLTVVPGARVLLLYPPGLDYIAAFFGCLYAGAIAVPAYPPRNNRNLLRLQTLVRDAQATVALTTSPILSRIAPHSSQDSYLAPLVWQATDQLADCVAEDWHEPSITGEDLALLQYTSGSTSAPKGVMISHHNLLHNERLIQRVFKQTDQSVIVGWLPLYHDMGLIGNIIQPMFVGAPCVLMSPTTFLQKPFRWLQAISDYRATTSGGPNFAYDLCVRKINDEQRATLDLSSWRVAFNGSEPVRHESLERFAETFADCGFQRDAFQPCYGLAEATLLVSGRTNSEPLVTTVVQAEALEQNRIVETTSADGRTLVSCGGSLPEQEIVVVNPETLTRCAPGSVGEIWVSGPSVAHGYWNDQAKTERTFRAYLPDTGEGPFLRTEDLGFLLRGELFVTGRLKDLIIIRGLNHYPQDIELTVERCHPALRPGCGAAFSVDVDGEEQLVIVQEVDHRQQFRGETVIESINEAIAGEHEIQAYDIVLVKLGTIPKTSSGKIQRYACREAFLHGALDIVARRTDRRTDRKRTEPECEPAIPNLSDKQAVELWLRAQVAAKLNIDSQKIDAGQPLLRYGLDSLMSVELAHTIETNLGVAVPLNVFLQGASVTELATHVLERQQSESAIRRTDSACEQRVSPGQRALWFLQQVEPESAAYNLVGAVRVLSKLDVPALQRAFQALVARHVSLRTTFESRDGEPTPKVAESVDVDFTVQDASTWNDTVVDKYLTDEGYRPFDLEAGPLLRVRLLKRSESEQVLLVSLHHIIADQWSLAILLNDLGVLYEAERTNTPVVLPDLPAQYADYVRWQKEILSDESGERLLSYWEKQLSGELPVLNLPTDRPRPAVKSYQGAAHTFRLNADLTSSLKVLGYALEATLYMTLMAAFQVLLYTYTDQEDILIGTTTTGRGPAEFASVVGYFVNPVVIRAYLAGNPTFETVLSRARQTVLEAFKYQDYPFQLLTERLQPKRDASRSPIFQAMFSMQNIPLATDSGLTSLAVGEVGAKLEMGALSLESLPLEQQTTMFDITLRMADVEGELAASLEYNTDLFDASTITRMAERFQTLLQGIVADPSQRLSELPLLTEAESRLLGEWNETTRDYGRPRCLHELFEEQVARTPEAIALVFEDERVTYAELDEQANQLAARLRQLGVAPEARVGLRVERSTEMVVGLLGILKAGGAYVPLDPLDPPERLAFMLEDSGAEVLITQRRLGNAVPAHPARVLYLDELNLQADGAVTSSNTDVDLENLCYVIYTSGSTGQPKGAMNTHQAVFNRLVWMQETYGLSPSDRVLQKTPFTFDVSVWEFFWPLMVGARLVIARPGGHQDPAYLARLITAEQVTTLHFVPSMLQLFLDEPAASRCHSLKRVICSGEALPLALQERFFELSDAELHNLYGPTEAAVDVTSWACERWSKRHTVPIGRPIANTQIHLLDRYLRPAPIGVVGELHIGGIAVGRGYCDRPELTAQRFIPDAFGGVGARLYKTGDLARYLPDGSIEFLGRVDHQVKLHGLRIELGEIEAALAEYPAVQEAVLMVREFGPGDQRLVAYLVPDLQQAAVIRRLLKLEKEGLPSGQSTYELPNGMSVVHLNKNETDFLYEELFKDRSYLKHGIVLDEGACVFDVGANIGLFSLFVGRECKGAKIYAFEPIPPVFATLQANASLYGLDAKLFECGLSDQTGSDRFTYYPHLSIVSSRFAELEAEREVVRSFLLKSNEKGAISEIDSSMLDELLNERLTSETFPCRLRTISEVMREEEVQRIDLLKIDVEKSELEVLRGIADRDWPKIKQIVVEVHDIEGRLAEVKNLLEERGYRIAVEQDTSLQSTPLYNIYARRADEGNETSQQYKHAVRWEGIGQLRRDVEGYLRERLPSYMVPSTFVFLDAFPILSNGKIDRRALPPPKQELSNLAKNFVSPRNPAEKTLAGIWAEVLRVARVGIHDNFFELGGDSILGIQIVARANRAGLNLSPRQIFQYQTVAQLAAVAGRSQASQAEQIAVTGAVPLTPIQHWFFEHDLPNPHHWNQSVLLETREVLDPVLLERALRHLLAHHDALRLRFTRRESGWEQFNTAVEDIVPFSARASNLDEVSTTCGSEWVDAPNAMFANDLGSTHALPQVVLTRTLSTLSDSEQEAVIEAAAVELQTSLNISTGPVLRAAYFDCGPNSAGKLLLVIHHLVVDGFSWRILIEDLQLAYQQESRGETVSLAPKTTSYKTWANGLAEYAFSPAVEQESAHWLTALLEQPASLSDFNDGPNTEAYTRTVSVALSSEQTRALLHDLPSIYRSYINEVLLAALAWSFSQQTAASSLLVDLEGHGREALVADADVSRTVGWFTAIYPVLLKLDKSFSPTAMLALVKEQLRQIPGHGVAYGIARYLRNGNERAACLKTLPQAEVSFNYLGQVDSIFEDEGLFESAREIVDGLRSPQGQRRYLLEINASIIDGCLKLNWTYSQNTHHQDTIERLAHNFLKALQEIINGAASHETALLTPADFPLTKLDQSRLAALLEKYGDVENIYPLAPVQEGLLFHSFYETRSGIYVEQLSFILRGKLDVKAFERAWQKVIDRHAILRTAFVWEKVDEPLQVVSRGVVARLATEDWRGLSEGEQKQRFDSWLQADRKQNFALDEAPLMRLALFHVGEDVHRFVWSHHHLLLDGWSLPLILNEVFTFYEEFVEGRELPLKPAPQYLNYIEWLQKQDSTGSEAFWRQTLAGFSTPTPLTLDRTQEASTDLTDVYGSEQAHVSQATTTALQSFARRQRLTLNTVLQAAWALVLHRYSRSKDIVFGTTVSGRPVSLPEVQETVGIFINTLPVRVQIPSGGDVSTWLQELQDKQAELQKHEHTPLIQIQGWSEVPRGTPLFESVLVLLNYPIASALQQSQKALRIEDPNWFEQTNYPLTIQVTPGPQLLLKATYDPHRFDAQTAQRMLGHFRTVLESIVAQPEGRLSEISLLTKAERQLLSEWNDTQRDYVGHQCLHELFEERVERTPNAIAVTYDDEQLSYDELNRRSNQLARHLRKLGVGPEVLVGICVERSIEMIVGLLGILKAGAAYVPLDSSYPLERLSFMLEDAAPGVLLTKENLLEILPSHWGHTICLDSDWAIIADEEEQNLPRIATEENLAYVIYTSGSTGLPKGAMLTHRGVVNCVRWMQETYELDETDRFLLKTSLNFDPSVWELFWTLWVGGRVVVARPEGHLDTAYLVETIRREQVTTVYFVPPMLRAFLEQVGVERASSLRRVICGGEGLPKETMDCFFERLPGVALHHSYGPTEASIAATEWLCVRGMSRGMAPIGRPLSNTQIRLLDEHLQLVPVGAAGELYIGGVHVGRGYLNRPELTAEKFVPDPFSREPGSRFYRTGDLARYSVDGNVEFLGRVDSQVKIRGYRIELAEIEAAISSHPAVKTALVEIKAEAGGDKQLVAYLLPQEHVTISAAEVRNFLRAKLPDYMVPSWIVMIAELPLTANGKVDRRRLPAPETIEAEEEQRTGGPRTPTEEVLAAIWSEVLELTELSMTANFFELGGHSLLATQVVLRIKETFSVEMHLRSLFEFPTVRELASQVEAAINAQRGWSLPVLARAKRNGEIPLSHAQQTLWFADQLTPDSPLYNVVGAVRLSGHLDALALERALVEIIQRHEVLRTTFSQQHGKPVQVVAPTVTFTLPVVDLRESYALDYESEARRLALEETRRPFDLSSGPLLRASLLRLDNTEHVALFTMHHIVSDGWSLGVLMKEVSLLYEAYSGGEESPLKELPIQYADYAMWQRAWLAEEVLDQQLNYWLDQLTGAPETLALPVDRPRPELQSFAGAQQRFELPLELSEQLKNLSRQESCSLFMTLLTAFQILLYYYSHQDQFTVGTPVAGRSQLATEDLIGFFVNTVVIRAELGGNPSFRELLGRVRETCLGAYANQDVPFAKVVEGLQPQRDLSRSPLFQVWFTMVESPLEKLRLGSVKLQEFNFEAITAKFDLALLVTNGEQQLSGLLEYNSDLFDSSTIERMLQNLELLLRTIVAKPDSQLDALGEVLTQADSERRSLKAQSFKAADRQALTSIKRKVIRG